MRLISGNRKRKARAMFGWLRRLFGKKKDLVQECIDFLENAPLMSGECCCGESMTNHSHPMNCGHSPVDSGEYGVSGFIEYLKREKKR